MEKVVGTIGYGFKIDRKSVLASLEKAGSGNHEDYYDDYYRSIEEFSSTIEKYPLLSLHYSGSGQSTSSQSQGQEYVLITDSTVVLRDFSMTFDIASIEKASHSEEAIAELFFMLGETGVGVGDLQWHLLAFSG